eukprot:TRINITY_DN252_c0_g1_i12.p1 TRINITY_DN252_c0_g1~~TRINITY_DN252_c0_g1_i12.p1  ORF type:complete len:324 (-),score=56.50 TRINITY_DN252_c0_g1_i12:90-1061(-)
MDDVEETHSFESFIEAFSNASYSYYEENHEIKDFIIELTTQTAGMEREISELCLDKDPILDIPRADVVVMIACAVTLKVRRNYLDFTVLLDAVNQYYENQVAKFRCIIEYFRVVHQRVQTAKEENPDKSMRELLTVALPGHIRIQLRTLETITSISEICDSQRQLCPFELHEVGEIENHGKNGIQIDFANKRIGGGVMRYGCTQEEIRFVISPECLISLLCKGTPMSDNQSITILGTERFSNYRGFSRTFRFDSEHKDDIPTLMIDGKLFIKSIISAIDAIPHISKEEQRQPYAIEREFNKASHKEALIPSYLCNCFILKVFR